ncbi:unnamed protein product [Caenorhabditis bovis]|uniref:C2H2-type domain-containing protein n=1 Tax=Caenorhabditis bovis TaxID=2654633 RepID=A0A8S1E4I0_9PELO|nr:unnamed protein product [Caenorhabditis bovis]
MPVGILVCPICKTTSPSKSKLNRHLDTHSVICGLSCFLCNRLIRHDNNLVAHWKQNCDGVRSIFSEAELKLMPSCEVKEAIYEYIITLEDTIAKYAPTCSDITTEFSDMAAFWKIPSTCSFCNLTLSPSTIGHHYDVHNQLKSLESPLSNLRAPYVCDICGLCFRKRTFLFKHWRETCSEVLAQVPNEGISLNDDELVRFVEKILEKSVVDPNGQNYDASKKAPERCLKNLEEEDENLDLPSCSYADDFSPSIMAPLRVNKEKWLPSTGYFSCSQCHRKFSNSGRLERHLSVFHEEWKAQEKCELCGVMIRKRSSLILHLRRNCQVMRAEIRDDNQRKMMSATDLMLQVELVKDTWKQLFKYRREKLINQIRVSLNHVPTIPSNNCVQPPFSAKELKNSTLIIPKYRNVTESLECPYCKIRFKTSAIVSQHVTMAHKINTQVVDVLDKPQTRVSVNPMKEKEIVFYDLNGVMHKSSRPLTSEPQLLEALNKQPTGLKHGARVKQKRHGIGIQTFVISLIQGEFPVYVILSEEEWESSKDRFGAVQFFESRPKIMEDMPQLVREES